MDDLRAEYGSQDDIPEQVNFRDLFTEVDGRWHLRGIEGLKTNSDLVRLQEAISRERELTKKTKSSLARWEELGELEDVHGRLDRLPALESELEAFSGNDAASKVDELVQKRLDATVNSRVGPLERKNKQLVERLAESEGRIGAYEAADLKRKIEGAISEGIAKKIRPEAMPDALMLGGSVFHVVEGDVVTKEGVGVTPGVDPAAWLTELAERGMRPHWFPESVGGGAKGGGPLVRGVANPWSDAHWNVSEQGRIYRDHGKDAAERMAKAAGRPLVGPKPQSA